MAVGLDLQELLAVAVDSVAPEASIQQAGPPIRIAGNSCIGIFHTTLWNFLEDSTAPIASTQEQSKPSQVC